MSRTDVNDAESFATLAAVVHELTRLGFPATLEYPGWILLNGRSYGTANEMWGWDSDVDLPSYGELNGDLNIPSDSTDVLAIAAAIIENEANLSSDRESEASKHCDAGYLNDVRFGPDGDA